MTESTSGGLDLGRPIDPGARRWNPFTVALVVAAVVLAVSSLIALRVAFVRLELFGASSAEADPHFAVAAFLAGAALLLGAQATALAGIRWVAEHSQSKSTAGLSTRP